MHFDEQSLLLSCKVNIHSTLFINPFSHKYMHEELSFFSVLSLKYFKHHVNDLN